MNQIASKNLLGYGKYIVIIGLFLIAGYTLLYITYEAVKNKLIISLNEQQMTYGRQAAKGIEAFVADQVASLHELALDEHIINLDGHGLAMIRAYYETHKNDVGIVSRIDDQGRIIYPIPYDPRIIRQHVTKMDDFEMVKRTRRAWVSDVFVNRRGIKSIMVQVPVEEGSMFKGTMAVLLPFDTIAKRYVEDIRIGENGYSWVISKDGIELSCPVPGHVGNSVFVNCRDFPDILAMARKMVKGEHGVATYQFNRVRGNVVEKTIKHAVYLPVDLGNTFWSIVIATPEDEVIGELTDFRNRLILIAAMLLLMVGGILFVMFRNQILTQEVERRKQAEEGMLAKAEELDRYFTGSLDLLCIADFNGYFRRLNPQWEKTLGYSCDEIIGQRFIDFVHPDDRAASISAFGELKKEKKILNFVNRCRHQDGSYRWIEWGGYVSENLIYTVARDITKRKQIEDKLRESQRQLTDIIEFLPDATFVIDTEGRVTAWNRAIAEMTGITAEKIIGEGDYAYTVPFYGERRPAMIDLILKSDDVFMKTHYPNSTRFGDTLSAEVFVPKLYNGRGAYIWITAAPLCRDDGKVIGAIESIRDISEKKTMESAIRESERRFKELSELLPEVIFETDIDLKVIFANKKAFSLYGYSEQDFAMGINALSLFAPGDRARVEAASRKRISGEFRAPAEYTAIKKDGTLFPVVINSVPVLQGGQPVGLRGVIVDMTELKRTEEQIRLQAMVLDQIRDLITITDLNGNISYVNEAQTRLMGYSKEALLGRNVAFYGEDPEQGATQEEIIRETRQRGFWRGDVVNITEGGEEVILDCRTQLVYDESGMPVAMAGFSTDITEQRRLQKALDDNRRDLRTAVDATDDMILMTDVEGKILLYNQELGERYETVSTDLTGYNIFDLMSPDIREERWRYFDAARNSGSPCFFEDISEERNWSNATYPVIDTSGNVSRMVLFGRDITERKVTEQKRRELEERLQRAEKMEALGLLSGGVAHDLNNILGVMVGYSELLLSRVKETGPAKSYAEKIMEASERAAAVIQDMLTLARRGVQTRHALNLNTLIMDFLKTPEYQHIEMVHPEIELRTQLDAKPLHILGSPVQLVKTILNLVANAAEAMPRGGVITIKTANQYLDRPIAGYDEICEGDYVVLAVRDTGEGISQSDIKHIFEPFYTRKVMGKSGTGLGLSVVWGTVKDHSGYINVESSEGKGTTFTLYFPVSREDIREKKLPASVSSYMGKGEKILVVDDVETQRELAQRMLEKLNYQVVTVRSGEEAVEYLKAQRMDIILLDMIMDPGMDGLDTYRKIIEIHPRQKAIIVSGYAETERVRQLQALGGGEYVMKPYLLETLGIAIRKELERVVPSSE